MVVCPVDASCRDGLSDAELIGNSEFMNGDACSSSGWVFSKPTSDKVVGTTANPKGAFDKCAVNFTGTAGSTAKLTTQASITGLQVGDVLRLSAWLKGQKISTGGVVIANIVYQGGATAKITLPVRAGTYPYEYQGQTATLTGVPTKLTVRVQMKNGKGKFFADNIHLTANPTARLELPPAP